MQETRDALLAILTGEFRIPADEISGDTTFEALGLDSLDLVELTMLVDERLGVEIPDDRLEDIATLDDAVRVVDELRAVSA